MSAKIPCLTSTQSNTTLQTLKKETQYVSSLQIIIHNHFIGQHTVQQGGDSRTVLLHGQVYFTDLGKYFVPVQVQYGAQ